MQLTLWEEPPEPGTTGVFRRPRAAAGRAEASGPAAPQGCGDAAPQASRPAAPQPRRDAVLAPSQPGAPEPPRVARAREPDGVEALGELAERYIASAHADNTRKAYQSDWQAFVRWCDAVCIAPLPASSVALERYLASLAARGLKASTIRRARIAIGLAHAHAGEPRPDQHARIRALERGIGRVHGAKEEGAEPLLPEHIGKLAKLPTHGAHDVRDRALILVGFAGAFRASELVGLDVGDLRFGPDGLEVTVRRAKDDQLGKGAVVRIPRGKDAATCPVKALSAWLNRVGRPAGPVFRHVRGGVIEHERLHPRAVTRAVQRAVGRAELEGDFSAHSLRSGLATSAYANGARETDIMTQGRWRSMRSLERYIRTDRIPSRPNPADSLL